MRPSVPAGATAACGVRSRRLEQVRDVGLDAGRVAEGCAIWTTRDRWARGRGPRDLDDSGMLGAWKRSLKKLGKKLVLARMSDLG